MLLFRGRHSKPGQFLIIGPLKLRAFEVFLELEAAPIYYITLKSHLSV